MAGKSPLPGIAAGMRRHPALFRAGRRAFRVARGLPAAVSRALFPSSGSFGPARGFFSGIGMVGRGEVRGEVILESQRCPGFPDGSLVRLSGLSQDREQPWPVFWMEMPGALLTGSTLCPRNKRGEILAEATFSRQGDRNDPAFGHFAKGRFARVEGNATSLVSRWGGDTSGNKRHGGAGYWHWLMDSVSRLSLMDRFPEDTRVITPVLAPWMAWFLDELGLSDRIIQTEARGIRVENFYFSSPSSMTGCWNPMAVSFLRERFLGKASARAFPRRFYILREGFTRRVLNDDEVREFFESRGWALVAPERLSIPDQIALFSGAEAVAGLHGSAFTNLLWSAPGSAVIELVPHNFLSGAFEWLARMNRMRHDFLICPADHRSNITVDLGLLESRLRASGM